MKTENIFNPDDCQSPYLDKLMSKIANLKYVVGQPVDCKNLIVCVEIEIPFEGNPQRILVEISVSIDDTISLQADFNGKLFALSTEDPEVFIENALNLFSKTGEIYKSFGWIISIPPGLDIDKLTEKEVFLNIHRTEPLESTQEFGTKFMEILLNTDELMSSLVGMING